MKIKIFAKNNYETVLAYSFDVENTKQADELAKKLNEIHPSKHYWELDFPHNRFSGFRMTFVSLADGSFKATSDNKAYQFITNSFREAISWLYNMADNNHEGNLFIEKICKTFEVDTQGKPIYLTGC